MFNFPQKNLIILKKKYVDNFSIYLLALFIKYCKILCRLSKVSKMESKRYKSYFILQKTLFRIFLNSNPQVACQDQAVHPPADHLMQ